MDKDEIKGKAKEIAGRTERGIGKEKGDTTSQMRGSVREREGKAQKTVGKAKSMLKAKNKKAA